MEVNYPKIIAFVLKQEGGYTNDPHDPGGATNFGITIADARKYWKSDATSGDVKAMPLSVAKDIYASKYWLKVAGPDIAGGLDLCTMDSAVNSGVGRADKWLAKAIPCTLRSYPDLAKASRQVEDLPSAVKRYCAIRLSFLHSLKTWGYFGKGWGRRVADLQALGIVLALQATGKTTGEIKATLGTEVAQSKKASQKTAAGSATGTATSAATVHQFWAWDWQHILPSVLVVGVILFFVSRAIQHARQVSAYNEQIASLSAVIPDTHV